jgi:hypothetical protein
MKTSFPLKSMPAGSLTCNIGNRSAWAAANKTAADLKDATKQHLFVMRALSSAFVINRLC